MTTFSVTPYLNEIDVLEIRLATLDDVVDVHVIAEATMTHTGHPKELDLVKHQDRLRPWQDKIRYVPVSLDKAGEWGRENGQRRALTIGMEGLEPDDRILLSDLDEIPHPDAVRDAEPGTHLMCHMHVGRLNWRWPGTVEEGFTVSRILTGQILYNHDFDLQVIRDLRWTHNPDLPVGWHLSYMGDIRAKLDAFAHTEMQATDAQIQAQLEHGHDLFGREFRNSEWVDLDQLPPYVAQNRERFAHMLVPRPERQAA